MQAKLDEYQQEIKKLKENGLKHKEENELLRRQIDALLRDKQAASIENNELSQKIAQLQLENANKRRSPRDDIKPNARDNVRSLHLKVSKRVSQDVNNAADEQKKSSLTQATTPMPPIKRDLTPGGANKSLVLTAKLTPSSQHHRISNPRSNKE